MGFNGSSPHIVVFVYPVHGRLIPAMVFASRLVESGAKVSFLYPDYHASRLADAKARLSKSVQIHFVPLHAPDFDSAPSDFSRDFALMPALMRSLEQFIDSLPSKPSCLISDEVLSATAKSARKFQIPRFILIPESASAFSATMFAPKLAKDSRLPLPIASDELVEISSLGIIIRTREYLSPYLDTFPWGWCLDHFIAGAVEAQAADGILINTFRELEPSILDGLERDTCLNPNRIPVEAVGPLVPDVAATTAGEHEEELATTMEFLDGHSPASVVFVAFGTLFTPSEEEARQILDGLQESGYPFVWVFRCEGEFVPGSSNPGLILRSWAPQLQILSHPSTGLFLTHCGWNSSLESISLGVPIVGYPLFMDQPINCKLLTQVRKSGIKLDALESSEIARAVKEAMESKEIRRNALELKRAADRVPKSLDFFVEKFK